MTTKIFNTVALLVGLLINSGHCSADIRLGSLFTSADERRTLNNLRQQDLLQNASKNSANSKTKGNNFSADIVVNGIVQKSNGEKFMWINGKQIVAKKDTNNLRIYRGPDKQQRILVGLPGQRAMNLKPGQRLNGNSGKVTENFLHKKKTNATDKTKKSIAMEDDSSATENEM